MQSPPKIADFYNKAAPACRGKNRLGPHVCHQDATLFLNGLSQGISGIPSHISAPPPGPEPARGRSYRPEHVSAITNEC